LNLPQSDFKYPLDFVKSVRFGIHHIDNLLLLLLSYECVLWLSLQQHTYQPINKGRYKVLWACDVTCSGPGKKWRVPSAAGVRHDGWL